MTFNSRENISTFFFHFSGAEEMVDKSFFFPNKLVSWMDHNRNQTWTKWTPDCGICRVARNLFFVYAHFPLMRGSNRDIWCRKTEQLKINRQSDTHCLFVTSVFNLSTDHYCHNVLTSAIFGLVNVFHWHCVCLCSGKTGCFVGISEKGLRQSVGDATSSWRQGEKHWHIQD